ncbi:hypothetical protein LOTGIDRAFT_152431 [Lottia gigantea]|uniref:Reelin domain-containing protein n=1 Tax=Lottia gigantea TaxID=225164 RepID=V4AN32_LOTGI|nr:hypothetical protein LOTGIDRAFT_152431 [Lottia gigantea]ESP05574.1 hypothetical protein LOTGIDRAFT_152431 [Lottia gigantea]
MTSMLAVVIFIGIASVNAQWNNWAGGFNPGFSLPQSNANQPNEVSCRSEFQNNQLEVSIRPRQSFFFAGGSGYTIEVTVTSYDIEGPYTIAVTDLSTDNPVCLESDLGFIATNGQSPNNGLLSLFTGQLSQPQSAGVVGEIDVVLSDQTTETFIYNTLYRDFREFRGLGVGLCTQVTDNESVANFNPFFPVRRNTRQLCEYPVLCCKLGLSSTN